MGKYLRIKTCTLLLAWLVIFAHGVIPHHHSDDNCGQVSGCHDGSASVGNNLIKSIMITNPPADAKVCHLSGLLYQNFNPENLLPCGYVETIFLPICISGKIYINSTVSFISPQARYIVGFRGPPSA